MATSLRWIGGGNDRASNPNDWLPSQVPASGDILSVVPDATYPGPFTMNVRGNDLAGKKWREMEKAATLVMLQPFALAREPTAWIHAPSQPLM